jgi:pimeloyl-ACP methyl ester carboxylesterase
MRSIRHWSGVGTPQSSVLLMPGRHSRAEDFESNGFVAAVRERAINVEVVAVDAHLGFYANGRHADLVEAVYEDVVRPLLSEGRRSLWFVGTSLGAFGTVAYVKKHPESVRGMLLMGAYLGEEPLVESISKSGGLSRWEPKAGVGYDYENRTWQWLKGYAEHSVRPSLYLAYGSNDRFALTSQILQSSLPSSHVLVDPNGSHDFDTWLRLWTKFLDCCGRELELSPNGSLADASNLQADSAVACFDG